MKFNKPENKMDLNYLKITNYPPSPDKEVKRLAYQYLIKIQY